MYLNAEILLQFCYVSVMANAEWLHIELRKTQINEYQNYQETNIKPKSLKWDINKICPSLC